MHNWQNAILNENDKMSSAIDVLNNEALRIVMVVNDENKLVGTITDGDIRRGILKQFTLDSCLHEFMFKTPKVATLGEDKNSLMNKMQQYNILQIPIVDDDMKVVGLETLLHLLKEPLYKNPVFLMAGGFGKRLRPLTNDVPKPLLNVGAKPILETILEQFVESGFKNIYISTHYKAEMVKEHFGDGEKWDINIEYIDEDEPLGTAGALGLLPDSVPDLPLIIMNGDLLTKVDFEKLLDFHNSHEGVATMCVREYDFQVPYGVVKVDEHFVSDIVEKPIHSFFINAGIYVLDPDVVRSVKRSTYLDMPDLLSGYLHKNIKINMFPIHEYWLDIGEMKDYQQAQLDVDK